MNMISNITIHASRVGFNSFGSYYYQLQHIEMGGIIPWVSTKESHIEDNKILSYIVEHLYEDVESTNTK